MGTLRTNHFQGFVQVSKVVLKDDSGIADNLGRPAALLVKDGQAAREGLDIHIGAALVFRELEERVATGERPGQGLVIKSALVENIREIRN